MSLALATNWSYCQPIILEVNEVSMAKRLSAVHLQELIESSKDEATKHAPEILVQLYEGLLKLPEMMLADGTTARVEAYYPPQPDDEGQQHCGIDVRLSSGDLLEFTIRNTGWERSLMEQCKRQPSRRSR